MRVLPAWANWKFGLKAVGISFLLFYFWTHPLQVELVWIAIYIAIAIGIGLLFGLVVNPILDRFAQAQRIDVTAYGDRRAEQVKRRPWVEALMLPGEDGFFFVPLLLIGINPVTAALASVAYAAIHYPEFPIKHCVSKVLALYLIATLVLPHGLATVVLGHVLLDAFAYVLWTRTVSQPVAANGDRQ